MIERVNVLETLKDVRELRPFLAGAGQSSKGRGTAAKRRPAVKIAARPARKQAVKKK
jgi:hypothetical protein